MKERFEKISAGMYVWDAPHKMILIEKRGSKWRCDFIRKSDDKEVAYRFITLKECFSFIEFWIDNFNDLIDYS